MKVLVIGANGQLGQELLKNPPANCEVVGVTRETLDITQLDRVMNVINHTVPDIIINASAYTAVDRAESERDLAFAVNANGAAHIAHGASIRNIRFIHVSTDFVFDGTQSHPYHPDAKPHPINVYGASKWQGEQRIANTPDLSYTIVRTSWLYSAHGGNFVKTILRLIQEKNHLSIVSDQIGTPTWSAGLSHAIWSMTHKKVLPKMIHWSDEGVASWYDFAVAIQEEAIPLGLVNRRIPIHAIRSTEYPLPAKRPHFSVLDKTTTWDFMGFRADHWRQALRHMMREVRETTHS